jgi:hypothetical protein
MYGFDYELEPVTEGALDKLKTTFANIWGSVWEKIKKAAEFLKTCIKNIGAMLRSKLTFAGREDSAKELVKTIGEKTEKFIIECSRAINAMYDAYSDVGNVKVRTMDEMTKRSAEEKEAEKDMTHRRISADAEGRVASYDARVSGGMSKGDNVDARSWDRFQERFGQLFTGMHKDAEDIKKDLLKLKAMPPLSYNTTLEGYKQLKNLYSANGKFGQEWSQLRTAHEFANEGKIKVALGKIVSMYNVAINAVNAFGNRLSTGKFKDDKGKGYRKGDEIRNTAKSEQEKIGKADAAAANNTTIIDKHGRMGDDTIASKITPNNKKYKFNTNTNNENGESGNESALLSRLYDMAYEDAMHDFEMKSQYISAFESVPDAFESFEMEDEFVDDFVPDPMFE